MEYFLVIVHFWTALGGLGLTGYIIKQSFPETSADEIYYIITKIFTPASIV